MGNKAPAAENAGGAWGQRAAVKLPGGGSRAGTPLHRRDELAVDDANGPPLTDC